MLAPTKDLLLHPLLLIPKTWQKIWKKYLSPSIVKKFFLKVGLFVFFSFQVIVEDLFNQLSAVI